MKKVFLFLLMAVATLSAAYAQQEYHPVPFPTGKAYWCERFDSVGVVNGYLGYIPLRYAFFTNGEDTLIDGISYKKLFYSPDGDTSNSFYYGGIFEDSLRRVHYCGHDSPHQPDFISSTSGYMSGIIYDFSIKVGDTLLMDDLLIVTRIDTIDLGGVLRKRFHFEYMDFTWIEGIGSTNGLLFYNGMKPLCEYCSWNKLLCVIQNDSLIYHWGTGNCFTTNTITSPEVAPSITAYPNPAKDRITFDFSGAQFETLQVINTAGVVVREARLGGQTQYSLPLKGLPAGVYLYRLQNGETATQGKFIVEN